MASIDLYFDEIDSKRVARARELSSIKQRFASGSDRDQFGIGAKAVIVLSYAHWEGFYNECSQLYLDFLKAARIKVRDVEWMLLLGVLNRDMEALKDRNHSVDARFEFVSRIQKAMDCGFEDFASETIKARSNLDFDRLSQNYRLLKFDLGPFQSRRIRLEKELVGWRHRIAHGDSPDLTAFDIAHHIDFTNTLLITLSDQFQQAMLARL